MWGSLNKNVQVGRGRRNDSRSHPQSRRSKSTRDGMRAAVEHWRGWRNTFRPVITAPRQESIKREEDPPRWHLESLRAAALMNQTVSVLNTPVFWRLPSMLRLPEIIDALCREKDSQQIWSGMKNVTLPNVTPAKQPQDQRKWFCFPARPTYTKKGFLFCTCCKKVWTYYIVLRVLHYISSVYRPATHFELLCFQKAPTWSTCDMQAKWIWRRWLQYDGSVAHAVLSLQGAAGCLIQCISFHSAIFFKWAQALQDQDSCFIVGPYALPSVQQ